MQLHSPLEALRAKSKTFAKIGTPDPTSGVLNTADGTVDIRGETVSANFVDVYGVPPKLLLDWISGADALGS
jgi:hypothetical protein